MLRVIYTVLLVIFLIELGVGAYLLYSLRKKKIEEE